MVTDLQERHLHAGRDQLRHTNGCQWQGNAGGDSPQYIHDYLGFFQAHAADLAFEAYFDEPNSYIRSALDVNAIGPNAPAAYQAYETFRRSDAKHRPRRLIAHHTH